MNVFKKTNTSNENSNDKVEQEDVEHVVPEGEDFKLNVTASKDSGDDVLVHVAVESTPGMPLIHTII